MRRHEKLIIPISAKSSEERIGILVKMEGPGDGKELKGEASDA